MGTCEKKTIAGILRTAIVLCAGSARAMSNWHTWLSYQGAVVPGAALFILELGVVMN